MRPIVISYSVYLLENIRFNVQTVMRPFKPHFLLTVFAISHWPFRPKSFFDDLVQRRLFKISHNKFCKQPFWILTSGWKLIIIFYSFKWSLRIWICIRFIMFANYLIIFIIRAAIIRILFIWSIIRIGAKGSTLPFLIRGVFWIPSVFIESITHFN